MRSLHRNGAACLAALALGVLAGCGGTSTSGLPSSQERELLGLISSARSATSAHDLAGLQDALSSFVADVGSAQAAQQITSAQAARLVGQARAVETQAVRELGGSPSAAGAATSTTTTTAPSATPTTTPAAPAVPPGHAKHDHGHGPPPGHGPKGPHGDGGPHGHGGDNG